MKTLSTTLLASIGASLSAQGLTLTAAQELALSKNPLIPAAAARVEAARARSFAMLAEFGPHLSANAVGAKGGGSMMFSPNAMGIDFQHAPPQGILAAGVTIEWRVFSFGQSDSVRNAGRKSVARAEAEFAKTKLDVIHDLRIEFAMALRVQSKLDGWKAQLEAAQELERITNEKYTQGKIPQAYVFRATADRLRAEREMAKSEAELQGAIAGVAVCCGADISVGRLGEWDVPMQAPDTYESAVEGAHTNSPEIAKYKAQVAEYRFRESAARQSSLPQFSVTAMGDALSNDAFGSRSGTNIGLLMSMPIFDGGLRRAESAEARANRAAAEFDLQNARNNVRREVIMHWAQWAASDRVVEAGKAELAASQEAYRIAKIRYEEGKSIQAEVSQALADLQMSRAAMAEALEYKQVAWSHLMLAIGRI